MFGGPWMVGDHYVVIKEWRPYFQPQDSPISTLRVWVRLPGLPLEYFDSTILKIIGDKIGKTVRLDHTTLEGSRGNFARICVEVDLSKPLLSKYRLRRRVRRVEYEGLHTICYTCGCYGHVQENCQEVVDDAMLGDTEGMRVNPVFQPNAFEEIRPEVEEDFGPWMKVARSGRKGRKAAPANATPVAPSGVENESKNGNKFAALSKEDLEDLADEVLGANKEGVIEQSAVIEIEEDMVAANKENVEGIKEPTNGRVLQDIPQEAASAQKVCAGPQAQECFGQPESQEHPQKASEGKTKPKPQLKGSVKGGVKKPNSNRPAKPLGRPSTLGSSRKANDGADGIDGLGFTGSAKLPFSSAASAEQVSLGFHSVNAVPQVDMMDVSATVGNVLH
ncbi:hypothetical protein LINPERHAP2_LOCUS3861 [Linum perenne]